MPPKMTGESKPRSQPLSHFFQLKHDLQLNVCAVTGNSIGLNSTAERYKFQIIAMNVNGRDHFPKLHLARLNFPAVRKHRPKQISAYAVMVGTAAALTSDVNATGEGKIVQSNTAATTSMIVIALRGSFLSETAEIHPEKGRTPSRATAQIRREAATPDTVVLKIKPRMQTMTMTTWPPLPNVMA